MNERRTSAVAEAIAEVAPDIDVAAIDPDEDLWYGYELDSMDQVNIMVAISQRTGVEIPEAEYPKLRSLAALDAYVREATAAG